jgi:hypothetical protein
VSVEKECGRLGDGKVFSGAVYQNVSNRRQHAAYIYVSFPEEHSETIFLTAANSRLSRSHAGTGGRYGASSTSVLSIFAANLSILALLSIRPPSEEEPGI